MSKNFNKASCSIFGQNGQTIYFATNLKLMLEKLALNLIIIIKVKIVG